MKKTNILLIAALFVTILMACDNKTFPSDSSSGDGITSQSTQSTLTTTIEASSSIKETLPTITFAQMDVEAISQGDFSSIIGKWETVDGNSFTFNSIDLIEGGSIQEEAQIVEGVLMTGIRGEEGYGIGWMIIPAGVPIPRQFYMDEDQSDINRDRMFGAQTAFINIEASRVYYRVSPQMITDGDPLTNNNTGVHLENGSVTIEYANEILGPLNWQVIESNYNRTDGIPFEVLLGENGFLYRVYQNGIILNTDYQIVYHP